MPLLTIAHLFAFSIRWIHDFIRNQRYAQAMRRAIYNGNILIQRSEKSKLRRPLSFYDIRSLEFQFSDVLLHDNFVKISNSCSEEINLQSWTSYLNSSYGFPTYEQNLTVLLEARRPANINDFIKKCLKVPTCSQIHVLAHGCPIAWKTTEPFGIIIRCSFSDLLVLTEAFGQDCLTLDEDLELLSLRTIQTVGTPKSLELVEDPELDSFVETQDISAISSTNITETDEIKQNEKELTEISNYLEKPSILSFMRQKSDSCIEKKTRIESPAANLTSKKSENIQSITLNANFNKGRNNSKNYENISKVETKKFSKPPNILIYCGVKDTLRKFEQVKNTLEMCVNLEAYTLYHLKDCDVAKVPWQANTSLLVISGCTRLTPDVQLILVRFLENGGNILSFCSSLETEFVERTEVENKPSEYLAHFKIEDSPLITTFKGRFIYLVNNDVRVVVPCLGEALEDNNFSSALIVHKKFDTGGNAIFSQLLLERNPMEFSVSKDTFTALKQCNSARLDTIRKLLDLLDIDTTPGEPPELTPCMLLARRIGIKEAFLDSIKHRLEKGLLCSKNVNLHFETQDSAVVASASTLPIITDYVDEISLTCFNSKNYWSNLHTESFGQLLFYTDVITSTMHVFDSLMFSLPNSVGPIAIAGRQTGGKGRGGNVWLSPLGCAMFTLPLSLNLDSLLGQKLSFLQHIMSVALVRAVRTLPGYEDLNIRLKWPNDIYYGTYMKLGGVLVVSTILGSNVYATIGCGLNVFNNNPTICVNDLIELHNSCNPSKPPLAPLDTAQVIGRAVTEFENLVKNFQKHGHEKFCELYYNYWLHGGSKVKVHLDTFEEGLIIGLDEYGFLCVKTKGQTLSVQPDGNSFDMMHNLIFVKTKTT